MPAAPTPTAAAHTSDLAYAARLWKAADTLRGQVAAAEYKHVVLGLLFLKYISDAFESCRAKLKEDLDKDGIPADRQQPLLEDRDELAAERVFWVPPESRWQNLQNQAARPDIATLIDDAILAVERDNPNLKNKLPRDYARRGIEPVKMKGLIDLIAGVGFKGTHKQARDQLGRGPFLPRPFGERVGVRGIPSGASSPRRKASSAASSTRPAASFVSSSKCSNPTSRPSALKIG